MASKIVVKPPIKETAIPSLIKDSVITFITRGLLFATSLATGIIISRMLGPSLKGSYSIIVLIMGLASLLTLFGLGASNVYYGARNLNELPTLTGNSFLAALGLGALGIAVVELATLLPAFQNYLIENGLKVQWLQWLIWLLPIIQLQAYLVEIVRATGNILCYNAIALGNALTKLVGTALLVWFLQQGLNGAIYSWIISMIVTSLLTAWLALRAAGASPRIDWSSLRRSLAFGIRLHPGNIAQFLNYRLDVFFVASFLTPAEVGFYITATALVEQLWQIPHAMRTVLLHRIAAASDESTINVTTGQVSRMVFGLVGGLCLVVALGSKTLIHLLYGADYIPAAPAIIALLPGVWALSIGKLLATHLAGRGRPEAGTLGAIVSLLITISLDILFIPRLGIIGASIASSIAYFLSTAVILFMFLRYTGLNLADVFLLRREDILVLRRVLASTLRQRP